MASVNCTRVLSSPYAVVPATTVPITIPGFGWCIVSASLAIVACSRRADYGSAGLGDHYLFGRWLYLVYAEIVRLRTICVVYSITYT